MNKTPRSAQLTFIQALLSLFIFVVFFTALVGYGLNVANTGTIWATTSGVIALCVVAIGIAGRGKNGKLVSIILGTLAHVLLIAVYLLPGMWFATVIIVGVVFLAIWVTGIYLGARIDRERAERLGTTAP